MSERPIALSTRRNVLAGAAGFGLLAATNRRSSAAPTVPPIETIGKGSITVANNGDMPMAKVNGDAFEGTDGEMVSRIAAKLGLTIKPSLMDWSSTVESVRSGRADCMLGDMAWTKIRAKVLLTTDALYYVSSRLLMKKGEPHGETVAVDKLKGRSIGVLTGGLPIPELKKLPLSDLKFYDTTDACIRDVIQGRIDFATLDAVATDYLLGMNTGWGLEQIRMEPDPAYPLLTDRFQAVIGVNPNEPNLFAALNAGIAWLRRTGQIKEVLAKYGITDPDYQSPLKDDPRVGIDRSAEGAVIGIDTSKMADFSAVFA